MIIGWKDLEELGTSLSGSIHSDLLSNSGPFFAFRDDILQIVVVLRYEGGEVMPGEFKIGIITPGWTGYIPREGLKYLEEDIYDLMSKYKISKEVLKNYKNLIEEYKKWITKQNSAS